MAPHDSFDRHQAAAAGAVFRDRLLGIGGTAGVEPAAGRKKVRNDLAISGNYEQQQ
jgi:hypothetical protein